MIKLLQLLSIPFSVVYILVISIRNLCYGFRIFKTYNIAARVISVGNVTWGGTGKTPLVAFIAELLKKKNHNLSILIRGYGKDEPELFSELAQGVPVLVGRDRVRTGSEAVSKYLADTVILDDGFQYRRLRRDIDIICVDATDPFGNGFVIPAGSLREPLSSLKRADIFLITKVDLVRDKDKLKKLEHRLKCINPRAVVVRAIHRPLYFYKFSNGERMNIGELKNKELVLLSAIGSPFSFEKTIMRLGLKINKHFMFRDHYFYTQKDIENVHSYCRKHAIGTVITTQKDAVKLRKLKVADGVEFLILSVRFEITENEEGFHHRLFGIYRS